MSFVFDPVDCPAHYLQGQVETIEWVKSALTEEEYRGYLKGTLLVYLDRYQHKYPDNPTQDLEKARNYLNRLIEFTKESGG